MLKAMLTISFCKRLLPDADEALREAVQEKAPQELIHRQTHAPLFVLVCGVPPAKRNLAVRERDQAAVGYGDAVSVSAEIPDDVLGPAKRALTVDDPVVAEELPQPGGERLRMSKKLQLSMKTELTPAMSAFQPGHELAAKNAAEDFHGQENEYGGWIQHVRSGDKPPAATTQWTCGW